MYVNRLIYTGLYFLLVHFPFERFSFLNYYPYLSILLDLDPLYKAELLAKSITVLYHFQCFSIANFVYVTTKIKAI